MSTAQILVVEDDPRVADFLQRGLRAEGYGVQMARTGPEGLALARAGEAALVILDVMLPGMTGLDLCQSLRAEGGQVPVLMLTALSSIEDKVAGLKLGADDYLTKPFAFEELLARIEALLRRGREQRPGRPRCRWRTWYSTWNACRPAARGARSRSPPRSWPSWSCS